MEQDILLVKPSEDDDYIILRKDVFDIMIQNAFSLSGDQFVLEHKDNKCSSKCIRKGIDLGVKRFLAVIRAYEAASKGK